MSDKNELTQYFDILDRRLERIEIDLTDLKNILRRQDKQMHEAKARAQEAYKLFQANQEARNEKKG